MNHPLRYKGYRFYQTSFDDEVTDAQGRWTTVLNVRKDRGASFVWAGIAVVSLGLMLALYFMPRYVYALIEKRPDKTSVILAARDSQGRPIPSVDLERLCRNLGEVKLANED